MRSLLLVAAVATAVQGLPPNDDPNNAPFIFDCMACRAEDGYLTWEAQAACIFQDDNCGTPSVSDCLAFDVKAQLWCMQAVIKGDGFTDVDCHQCDEFESENAQQVCLSIVKSHNVLDTCDFETCRGMIAGRPLARCLTILNNFGPEHECADCAQFTGIAANEAAHVTTHCLNNARDCGVEVCATFTDNDPPQGELSTSVKCIIKGNNEGSGGDVRGCYRFTAGSYAQWMCIKAADSGFSPVACSMFPSVDTDAGWPEKRYMPETYLQRSCLSEFYSNYDGDVACYDCLAFTDLEMQKFCFSESSFANPCSIKAECSGSVNDPSISAWEDIARRISGGSWSLEDAQESWSDQYISTQITHPDNVQFNTQRTHYNNYFNGLSRYSDPGMRELCLENALAGGAPVDCQTCSRFDAINEMDQTVRKCLRATCTDSENFRDVGGFSCADWSVYDEDCSNNKPMDDYSYDAAAQLALQTACPVACNQCPPATICKAWMCDEFAHEHQAKCLFRAREQHRMNVKNANFMFDDCANFYDPTDDTMTETNEANYILCLTGAFGGFSVAKCRALPSKFWSLCLARTQATRVTVECEECLVFNPTGPRAIREGSVAGARQCLNIVGESGNFCTLPDCVGFGGVGWESAQMKCLDMVAPGIAPGAASGVGSTELADPDNNCATCVDIADNDEVQKKCISVSSYTCTEDLCSEMRDGAKTECFHNILGSQACECELVWSSPKDGAGCISVDGCPSEGCDNDAPWCAVKVSPCAEEQLTMGGSWFYC